MPSWSASSACTAAARGRTSLSSGL
jgi:hypothetical protein